MMDWKNVNNWHWIEKDCTEWAHSYLKEKLLFSFDDKEYSLKNIKGEVSVNVRKGKVRQIYDLEMDIFSPSSSVDFISIIDFMSDATSSSDLDIRFPSIFEFEDKKIIREKIWECLSIFQEKLSSEQGASLLVNDANTNKEIVNKENSRKEDTFNAQMASTIPKDNNKNNNFVVEKVNSFSTIEEEITINSPKDRVFDALTKKEFIMAWSRGSVVFSSSENSLSPNSSYNILGGNIETIVSSLVLGESFNASWRLRSWPSGHYSKISITLKSMPTDSNRTLLTFKQSGVPSSEISLVKMNWTRYYWDPIKEILGCSGGNIGNLF